MNKIDALSIARTLLFLIVSSSLLLTACSARNGSLTREQAVVEFSHLNSLPTQAVSYEREVHPILNRRCVVCHGCYDAPCQLKLSSPSGVQRGASKEPVYNGARFNTMAPTRLDIDAKSPREWRDKGFHSILAEHSNNPIENLEQSVMYRMLRLKQRHPQARVGMLSGIRISG